ncbi:MAG: oxygen-independent coproporphyrinogen oxidase [Campylobacterota bacterium]|nr:oxygen-independent coproporphyrinogen oxidase [Campylobacterota bacterium]
MLYIHIPFCDSKCHYCAFNSYTFLHELKEEYMASALKQLKHDIEKYDIKKNSLDSVFVGGGTPSTVDSSLYKELFLIINSYIKPNAEITFEANPNSATFEWLKGIKNLGANRVSFGVQSFDDKKLKFLGRAHDSKEALLAIENAKKAGFEKISIDIIYSTLFDTEEFLNKEFETIKNLPIEHLSLYSLTLEENTKFSNTPNVVNERDEAYSHIIKKAKDIGFFQYEVSNFAKEGESSKSKHNLGYWQYKPYLGIGAGAVGCIKNIRTYPHKDVKKYINEPLFKECEELKTDDIKNEKILLSLRYEGGFDISLLDKKEREKAELLKKENKIIIKNSVVFNKNYFLADEIALFILS